MKIRWNQAGRKLLASLLMLSISGLFAAEFPVSSTNSILVADGDVLVPATVEVGETLPDVGAAPIFWIDAADTNGWEFAANARIPSKIPSKAGLRYIKNYPEDGDSLVFNSHPYGAQLVENGFNGRPYLDFSIENSGRGYLFNAVADESTAGVSSNVLNGIGMLFMKLLTNRPQMFADVRTHWSADAVKRVTGYDIEGKAKDAGGFIHLINSGACCLDACGEVKDENGNGIMKEWYNVTEEDADKILEATTWNAADNGYFRGGGYSSRFLTRAEMPATMIRLNLVKGLGPVLQIVEGWTVNLPDEVSDTIWKRTDYTWPCTWFAPRCTGEGAFKSAYDLMNNWGANHGAISYGHIGADIITMASMLRIPVALHNVPDEKIFRPACWGAFGTKDLEGADFRACENYGPLYK